MTKEIQFAEKGGKGAGVFDFAAYIQTFNSGNDRELVERFWADDLEMVSGSGNTSKGKESLLRFLDWAHDGIREIMRVQTFVSSEETIFAEIDMDFHATTDKPDYVFGPLKKGEFLTVKMFCLYTIRNSKIIRLKMAAWPPNAGVSDPPAHRFGPPPPAFQSIRSKQGLSQPPSKLGGTLEQRQAFIEYSKAFSKADFDRFSQYYNDDVTCELGSGITLRGKDGIVNFYREMFKTVRENLTIHRVVADENGIAADITTQFTAIEDAPNFVVGPLKKGECIRGRVFVHYVLRDGKISKISVARAGEMSRSQPA